MAGLRGRVFYRYMSEEEVEAIEEKKLLRGGRPGQTHWTEDYYELAGEAQARLALLRRPDKRMRFRIKNEPAVQRENAAVEPGAGQPGGGTEYATVADEKVEVEVIAVEDLE